jgi:plastocyanin
MTSISEPRRWWPPILLLTAAASLSVVAVARAEDFTVRIGNFTFDPPQLIVRAGTTVTWRNDDDIPHTIAAADRKFKSKTLDTDDGFSFTFTEAGSYAYFCSLHPHMTGTIVVQAKTAVK